MRLSTNKDPSADIYRQPLTTFPHSSHEIASLPETVLDPRKSHRWKNLNRSWYFVVMDHLQTEQPVEPAELAGRRFALIGKFAGMSKRAAQKLIRQHHGTICEKPDKTVDCVVFGEAELLVGGDGRLDDRLDDQLKQRVHDGSVLILGETELWQQLRLLGSHEDTNIQNLYTSAMLAELLDIPTTTVRRWHRRGLIQPKLQIHRLAYFAFEEVLNARALAALLAKGISPGQLEKKLTSLEKVQPEVKRQIAQLSVIIEGRDILLRQDGDLLDARGQMRIDFDTLAQRAVTDEGHDTLAFEPAQMEDADNAAKEMTPTEMLEAATQLEDEHRLSEAALLYRTALAAYGPDADVHFRLAELLYRMGEIEAARERYYAAIELDEDFVEARANLGCVLSELGEINLAMAAWSGALAFHPDYADVHLHMARCLDELSRERDAEEHWENFLVLAPESPWAEQARQRLKRNEAPSQP